MKKLVLLLVLLAAGLAGVACWISPSRSSSPGEDAYTLAAVEYGDLVDVVSASAALRPQEVVLVSSDVPGKVLKVFAAAEVGATVEEGDPLLQLDDTLARRKLEQARIGVRLAQAAVTNAERARDLAGVAVTWQRKLTNKDLGSQAEMDKADAQLRAAEDLIVAAQVRVEEAREAQKQAQLALDLSVVRVPSPPYGADESPAPKRRFTLIDRKVELGQQVGPAAPTPLCTLAGDLRQMRVHAQVAEGDVSKVHKGLPAEFTVSAYSENDVPFRGEVLEVRLLPTTVHGAIFYETIIGVPNERDPVTKEWRLRPGMTAAVDILLRKHAGVWKVPTAALSFHLDESYRSDEARAKVVQWQTRAGRDQWKPVWALNDKKQPWPLFVRIGGADARGEPGIRDAQFHEVLEWDPEAAKLLDPNQRATFPRVLIGAPPVSKGGLFNPPSIKF